MQISYWLVTLMATITSAAPNHPISLGTDNAVFGILSQYFNLLSQETQDIRDGSSSEACDLSKAVLPTAPNTTALTPPSNSSLKHVAIGRGTQNYTCTTSTTSSIPYSIGATATLYNATCTAALYPSILALLPPLVLAYNLSSSTVPTLFPTELLISGHHYFSTVTTPTFDMNTVNGDMGIIPCAKNASTSAPESAVKGQGIETTGAVPWLRLLSKSGGVGSEVQVVYRVNTAGGAAPATCQGMESSFEVQYAAEYWFYA